MKLSSVFKPRNPAATAGTAGAAAKNPPMAARFTPRRELLMRCRPGSIRGLDDTFPASLRKATIEPVNVTPPYVAMSTSSPEDEQTKGKAPRTNEDAKVCCN
jgi:hypothetical protein